MSEETTKRARAVSAQVQNRLDIIKDYLCLKYKRSQIIQEVRDKHKEWHVSLGTIDSYIRKAREQFLEDTTQTVNMLKSEAATDLRFMMKTALSNEDIALALRCRAELNKLYALYGLNGTKQEAANKEKDVTPDVQLHLNEILNGECMAISTDTSEDVEQKVKPDRKKKEQASAYGALGL